MDNIIDIISESAEPVVETLQEWGTEFIENVKDHAPQYIRYAVYSLKHLHI